MAIGFGSPRRVAAAAVNDHRHTQAPFACTRIGRGQRSPALPIDGGGATARRLFQPNRRHDLFGAEQRSSPWRRRFLSRNSMGPWQFLRQLVHHGFDGKVAFGIGSPSVGYRTGPVGPDDKHFPIDIGTAMIRDRWALCKSQSRYFPRPSRMASNRCQESVRTWIAVSEPSFRSRFDIMRKRRAVMRVDTLFFAGEPDFYRRPVPARGARKESRNAR